MKIYSDRCCRCNAPIASDEPIDPPTLCDPCLEALDLDNDALPEADDEYAWADLATRYDAQILRPAPRKRGA